MGRHVYEVALLTTSPGALGKVGHGLDLSLLWAPTRTQINGGSIEAI